MTGNPFYPLSVFGFKGTDLFNNDSVWIETLKYPLEMLNAAFGEYKLWLFSVPVAFGILVYQYVIKKEFKLSGVSKLFLIGLINFIFYFSFPTSSQPWIMVSSLRYSLPVAIPLILGVFMLAQKYKKEEWLGYFVVINMINVLTMTFYPKTFIILSPA